MNKSIPAEKLVLSGFTYTCDALPTNTGDYICITTPGSISKLPFSARYKVFNAYNTDSAESAAHTAIEVIAWARPPKWLWQLHRIWHAELQEAQQAATRRMAQSQKGEV